MIDDLDSDRLWTNEKDRCIEIIRQDILRYIQDDLLVKKLTNLAMSFVKHEYREARFSEILLPVDLHFLALCKAEQMVAAEDASTKMGITVEEFLDRHYGSQWDQIIEHINSLNPEEAAKWRALREDYNNLTDDERKIFPYAHFLNPRSDEAIADIVAPILGFSREHTLELIHTARNILKKFVGR